MGSASRLGVFLAATVGTALLLPSPTTGSILTQIDQAIRLEEKTTPSRPVLYKRSLLIEEQVLMAVKGKRERRQVRAARWRRSLTGDRLEVYLREGFPLYRHFESDSGVRTEHWTYRQKGVSYVFKAGELIQPRPF